VAQTLQSGAIPKVSTMPHAIRVIFEDIYAQGISHSFLIAVPFAVVSLIAILFLPNVPLTRMTTKERLEASEADLATVSVPAGMDVEIEPETAEPTAAAPAVEETAAAAEAAEGEPAEASAGR
jgi:hypothetical protein